MKKLLIASTALVSTAGFAFADGHTGVKLTGAAEMGIVDGDGLSGTQFWTDFDIRFTLAGETDGGLMFGAILDLDEYAGTGPALENASGLKSAVYIKGDFGSLTLGDTDGAFDWAMTETGMGTAIADDHTVHAGYPLGDNGALDGANGGELLRYDNTFGDFGVAVSYSINDTDTSSGDMIGVGVKYDLDLGGTTIGLGLAYQENDFVDVLGFSAKASISGFDAVLNYAKYDFSGSDVDYIGIGLGYTMDALLVHANWGQYDAPGGDIDGFGIVVNYDLGGGAVVALGYGSDDFSDHYSLGLRMDF